MLIWLLKNVYNPRLSNLPFQTIAAPIKCTKSSCICAWYLFQELGTYWDLPKSGWPSITNYRIDQNIRTLAELDWITVGICNKITTFSGKNIGVHTIRNRFRSVGPLGKISLKKPFISKPNPQCLLTFVWTHLHWTPKY